MAQCFLQPAERWRCGVASLARHRLMCWVHRTFHMSCCLVLCSPLIARDFPLEFNS